MSFVLSQFALNTITYPAVPRSKANSQIWPVWGHPVRALASQQQWMLHPETQQGKREADIQTVPEHTQSKQAKLIFLYFVFYITEQFD